MPVMSAGVVAYLETAHREIRARYAPDCCIAPRGSPSKRFAVLACARFHFRFRREFSMLPTRSGSASRAGRRKPTRILPIFAHGSPMPGACGAA